MAHQQNVQDKKPCAFAKVIQLVDAVLEHDIIVTILDRGPKHDIGRAESGNMIPSKPQLYKDVMSDLVARTPPAPTPQQVRNQSVGIPGVFNQTNALFRPVNVEELNQGRDK